MPRVLGSMVKETLLTMFDSDFCNLQRVRTGRKKRSFLFGGLFVKTLVVPGAVRNSPVVRSAPFLRCIGPFANRKTRPMFRSRLALGLYYAFAVSALALICVFATPGIALAQVNPQKSAEILSDLPGGEKAPATPSSGAGRAPVLPTDSEAPGDRGLVTRFIKFIRGSSGDEESDDDANAADIQRRINQLAQIAIRNYARGRLSEAKKNLNDLITLRPYESSYHFALALCFRKEGRFADSSKKYKDVSDLGGPKPLVAILMAESVSMTGNKERTFEELKAAAVGGRNIIHDVQVLTQLEKFKTDTEFIKLALALEQYTLMSTNDPMTNPFPTRGIFGERGPEIGIGVPEADGPGGPLTPDQQKELYLDARKAYDKILWYIKLEDDKRAMQNYNNLRDFFTKVDSITIPRIRNDFQRLQSRMDQLEAQIEGIRLKYYYDTALGHLQTMKQAFHDTEYGQVKRIFGRVKKLAQDMEETNDQYKPVADQILRAGNVWIERTRVRQEFESSKPNIQGVIISPDTKQALINGRIFNQGEHFGEFKVQKVENNRITFRYKGEEIPLVFRRY